MNKLPMTIEFFAPWSSTFFKSCFSSTTTLPLNLPSPYTKVCKLSPYSDYSTEQIVDYKKAQSFLEVEACPQRVDKIVASQWIPS